MATPDDDEFNITLNGAEVPIKVDLDEGDSLEPQQSAALRFILALGPNALEEAAPAVVQNYEIYRDMIADDDQVPPLDSLVDVWQQVRIERISVPPHQEASHAYFFIEAECNWDEEHGLEIRFRDGVALDASQQGDLGMDD